MALFPLLGYVVLWSLVALLGLQLLRHLFYGLSELCLSAINIAARWAQAGSEVGRPRPHSAVRDRLTSARTSYRVLQMSYDAPGTRARASTRA